MTTRHSFDEELQSLHEDLIKMGMLVEESIDKTIYALVNQDMKIAQKVYTSDDAIDDLESKIERKCLMLIARQQPLAKDLRTITTALKIITDMERIGDHSADIAEITMRMTDEKYIKPLIDIPEMAKLAKQMVNDAIKAFINQDMELAIKVCNSDDPVDDLFDCIKLELASIMKNNVSAIDQVINFLFIAKYLERMADHATNIAEWVIFNITGEHDTHMASHRFPEILDLP